jgi:hypothetical protein
MPYHASGAAVTGFICIQSVNAIGQTSAMQSCNAIPIPARGTAPALGMLSVAKNGSGSGTVTSVPAGLNCGSTCSQSVTSGTALTLIATAATDSTFAGWTGACSGTGSCAITVNAAATATATFNLSALSTPPSAPGNPSVIQLSADASGVTFAFVWTVATGATSYRYTIAFNDGSTTQQGTVTLLSLQLKMPYHASGAASDGYVCIQSVNLVGQTSADSSCAGLTVPARPGG